MKEKNKYLVLHESQCDKVMEFKVKNESLVKRGSLLIEWASNHMPVLNQIKQRFAKEKPLKGTILGACLHVTKETAVLIEITMIF